MPPLVADVHALSHPVVGGESRADVCRIVSPVSPGGADCVLAVADWGDAATPAMAVVDGVVAGAIRAMSDHRGETTESEHALLEGLLAAWGDARATSGEPTPAVRRPGSFSLVAVRWPRAYVVHAGHSRVCHVRERWLRSLTPDQTAYEDVLDRGVMSEDQMRRWGLEAALRDTPLIAIGRPAPLHLGVMDLEDGDALVVSTRTFVKYVPTTVVVDTLLDGRVRARDAVARLAAEAEAAGAARFALIVARFSHSDGVAVS